MQNVDEIEKAVAALPPEDLSAFREWFATFDGDVWDRQIEADAESGRLDRFADEALRDLRAGRCTDR